MREDDMQLLLRIRDNEEFRGIIEMLERDSIYYDELDLAKQFILTHEPFAEIEPEN